MDKIISIIRLFLAVMEVSSDLSAKTGRAILIVSGRDMADGAAPGSMRLLTGPFGKHEITVRLFRDFEIDFSDLYYLARVGNVLKSSMPGFLLDTMTLQIFDRLTPSPVTTASLRSTKTSAALEHS